MKLVLAGSPELVLSTFEVVIQNFEVVGIITNEDKPKGRGLKVLPTDVALLGDKYRIPVFKTNHVDEIFFELEALKYDLLLTFAFGQYIPEKILKLGTYPPLNIHGSILPQYRGAAPVQYAILNGDHEIGISLIEMTKQMDAGDVYFVAKAKIDESTTTEQGFKIISDLAVQNIVNWLNKVKVNDIKPIKQGNNFSLSPKISKSMAEISDELTIALALRKIRALNPYPGAFLFYNGKRLKVFNASLIYVEGALEFKFKDGSLWFVDFQFESKKRQVVN